MKVSRTSLKRSVGLATVLVMATFSLSGCWWSHSKRFYGKSDSYVCIFSGSANGGQKLIGQIAPGQPSFQGNQHDIEVDIPASNRFYLASTDASKRDALNDPFYVGFAQGPVQVNVQGQIRFKFNLNKACDWYTKSGHRNADANGDLGFNVRGADQANSGWFHYLAENQAQSLERVTREVARNYTWAQLTYDYPTNGDPLTGVVPAGIKPGPGAAEDFGVKLGLAFTKDLSSNIGGEYFCGTQTNDPLTGAAVTEACPPILFYPSTIDPADAALEKSQQALETAKLSAQQSVAQAELLARTKNAVLASEQLQQEINGAKLKTAMQQAQLDNIKCLTLAAAGDDCNGNRFPTYVTGTGSTTGTTGGK